MNYVTNRFIASRTTDFINRIEKLLFNVDVPKFYHKPQHSCFPKKLRYRFSRSTLQHVCELKRVVQTSICTSANIVCMSTAHPKSGPKFLIVIAPVSLVNCTRKSSRVVFECFYYDLIGVRSRQLVGL